MYLYNYSFSFKLDIIPILFIFDTNREIKKVPNAAII